MPKDPPISTSDADASGGDSSRVQAPSKVEDPLRSEASQWLASDAVDQKTGPGLDKEACRERLEAYFNDPGLLHDSDQLHTLIAAYRFLRDCGFNFGTFNDKRTPLLSAADALQQSEAWVLSKNVANAQEIDVLHEVAMRHRQTAPRDILPFLDWLVVTGQLSKWAAEVRAGPNGEESFRVARETIELRRVEEALKNGTATDSDKQRVGEIETYLESFKGDVGIFIYSNGAFDEFLKSDRGIALRGEPQHPKDQDATWKRDLLRRAMTQMGLPPDDQLWIEGKFKDENYSVGELSCLIRYLQFLTRPSPDGPALQREPLRTKLESYPRFQIKDIASIQRLQLAWSLAAKYSPDWLNGKGRDVILDAPDAYGNVPPETLHRLLLNVHVNVTQQKQSEWEQLHASISPFGWRRYARPYGGPRPNCREAALKLANDLPYPRWGMEEERKDAVEIVCTGDILEVERIIIQRLEKLWEKQQKLDDVVRLLDQASAFTSELPQQIQLVSEKNRDFSLIDTHTSLYLIEQREAAGEAQKLLEQARFYKSALASAKGNLTDPGAESEIQKVVDGISPLIDALERVEKQYGEILRMSIWSELTTAGYELFEEEPIDLPLLLPERRMSARKSATFTDYKLMSCSTAADGTLVYEIPGDGTITVHVGNELDALVADTIRRAELYTKMHHAFGKAYVKQADELNTQFEKLESLWSAEKNAPRCIDLRNAIATVTSKATTLGETVHGVKNALALKEKVPNVRESGRVGAATKKIVRGTTEFDGLVKSDNPDIVFKDEDKVKGADQMMTPKLKQKTDALATLVSAKWPGVKLRITEAWDEDHEHGKNSVHYEGRAIDFTTSDLDFKKLGALARLAVEAGFEWVYYEDKRHVHASVSSEPLPLP